METYPPVLVEEAAAEADEVDAALVAAAAAEVVDMAELDIAMLEPDMDMVELAPPAAAELELEDRQPGALGCKNDE